ncbi:hypothetical protein BT96DRAFT_1000750 [Gymnopus androsaceus JB14]|uniref:Uncharacterized protein n=1 Tax=Gymnopus androsaceus JB14 TaxID=1447944 RepID=A0A6A4H1E3_9AGAR|nr:hypothetical protein BT96DRAFT_1000750 [Gymnopus androsaceus JB14]
MSLIQRDLNKNKSCPDLTKKQRWTFSRKKRLAPPVIITDPAEHCKKPENLDQFLDLFTVPPSRLHPTPTNCLPPIPPLPLIPPPSAPPSETLLPPLPSPTPTSPCTVTGYPLELQQLQEEVIRLKRIIAYLYQTQKEEREAREEELKLWMDGMHGPLVTLVIAHGAVYRIKVAGQTFAAPLISAASSNSGPMSVPSSNGPITDGTSDDMFCNSGGATPATTASIDLSKHFLLLEQRLQRGN